MHELPDRYLLFEKKFTWSPNLRTITIQPNTNKQSEAHIHAKWSTHYYWWLGEVIGVFNWSPWIMLGRLSPKGSGVFANRLLKSGLSPLPPGICSITFCTNSGDAELKTLVPAPTLSRMGCEGHGGAGWYWPPNWVGDGLWLTGDCLSEPLGVVR